MKLTLEIPDTSDIDENEVKRMLAAKLYEAAKLSLGQAAELAVCQKLPLQKYCIIMMFH